MAVESCRRLARRVDDQRPRAGDLRDLRRVHDGIAQKRRPRPRPLYLSSTPIMPSRTAGLVGGALREIHPRESARETECVLSV